MIIESTNRDAKKTYEIPYGGTNTETSLVLYGRDSCNWGQGLLENILHIAENFCNFEPPLHPVMGQTYYNNGTKKISVYNGTSWDEVNLVPNTDMINIAYLDKSGDLSNSKVILSDLVTNLMPISGNTKPVKITYGYGAQPTLASHAVTKEYVDSILGSAGENTYIGKDAGSVSMTGPLKIVTPDRHSDPNQLSNIEYMKDLGILTTLSDMSSDGEAYIVASDSTPPTAEDIKKYMLTSTTYQVMGRKTDDGDLDTSDWFAICYFRGYIADGKSGASFELPFGYSPATVQNAVDYGHSISVTAKSIGAYKQLYTALTGEPGGMATIHVSRNGTEGEVCVHFTAMGFRPAQPLQQLEPVPQTDIPTV